MAFSVVIPIWGQGAELAPFDLSEFARAGAPSILARRLARTSEWLLCDLDDDMGERDVEGVTEPFRQIFIDPER